MNEFSRTIQLIENDKFLKLQNSKVAIFGVGGVGGFVLEGLVRSGIGSIDIYDNDIVDITNINRQIIALHSTIGKDKIKIAKQRALDINPKVNINAYKIFYSTENSEDIKLEQYDYIVDAIDSVSSKIELIEQSKKINKNIISCMGTGNKINPIMLEVDDISKTSVCPLAKIIRKELRKKGINNLKVIYSKEEPKKVENNITSSISFVPSVAGLIIASEVVKDLIC